MWFESHFKSSFGNYKDINLNKHFNHKFNNPIKKIQNEIMAMPPNMLYSMLYAMLSKSGIFSRPRYLTHPSSQTVWGVMLPRLPHYLPPPPRVPCNFWLAAVAGQWCTRCSGNSRVASRLAAAYIRLWRDGRQPSQRIWGWCTACTRLRSVQ